MTMNRLRLSSHSGRSFPTEFAVRVEREERIERLASENDGGVFRGLLVASALAAPFWIALYVLVLH